MFVDFKLFQRQDRAIFEGLGDDPSPLEHMALMPADRGAALWIRRWRELLAGSADHSEAISDVSQPGPSLSSPTTDSLLTSNRA